MTDESSYTAEVSSEDIHENIDKRSFNIFRRKENEKLLFELRSLRKKENLSEEEEKKILFLKSKLRKKIPEVEFVEDSFSLMQKNIKKEDRVLSEEELIYAFMENPSLNNFLSFRNNPKIFTEEFGDFLLYNLSENIKEGNFDAGYVLSLFNQLISMYKERQQAVMSMGAEGFKKLLRIVEDNYEEEKREIMKLEKNKN